MSRIVLLIVDLAVVVVPVSGEGKSATRLVVPRAVASLASPPLPSLSLVRLTAGQAQPFVLD